MVMPLGKCRTCGQEKGDCIDLSNPDNCPECGNPYPGTMAPPPCVTTIEEGKEEISHSEE